MSSVPGHPERRIPVIGGVLVAAGSVLVFLLYGAFSGLSFLAGGGLAALSMLWLRRSIEGLLLDDAKRSKRRALSGFFLRLLLIPLCLYVMIRFLFMSVFAAVAGFAVFHCSVFVEGLLEAFESRK